MPRSAKLGWITHGLVVPLLLSLALHGLLFVALWFWPTRTRSPTLAIESTHFTLDTRVWEPRSPTLLAEEELPPDLRGAIVQTSLAPQLLDAPPPHSRTGGTPAPQKKTSETPVPPGSGGGSNDGNLFPLAATATSVVYVLDCSVSMGMAHKLDFARRELISSLRRLPATVRFQVVSYNDYANVLILDGRSDLLPAEPATVAKVVSFLQTLEAGGDTNHLAALRRALDLHPDILFFLTDADNLRSEEITAVTLRNRGTVIHTIELTHHRFAQHGEPLARLARDNHGCYRRVSVAE